MTNFRKCALAATLAGLAAFAQTAAASAATVTVTPRSAPPGTPVKAAGAGFGAGEAVDVSVDRAATQLTVASASGGISTNLPLPASLEAGQHEVTAVGRTSGAAAHATLTITTPWLQAGYSARKTAFNPYENELTRASVANLDIAWTAESGTGPLSPPAVAGGRVFVGRSDGKVAAYKSSCGTDMSNCPALWTGSVSGAVNTSPAILSGTVYFASVDGGLHGFRANCASGGRACSPVWRGRTGGQIVGAPTIAGTRLFVAGNDRKLYAFSTLCDACAPEWAATLDEAAWTSPAVVNGIVYVAARSGTVYALRASDGTLVWSGSAGSQLGGALAISNGHVITGGSKVVAFPTSCGASTCAPAWTASPGPGSLAGVATAANRAFWTGGARAELYRVGQACGTKGAACTPTQLSNPGTGGVPLGGPVVAADVVYAIDNDGRLSAYAVDCTPTVLECEPLWTVTTGTPAGFTRSVAVSDGTLYAVTNAGRLYAFTTP